MSDFALKAEGLTKTFGTRTVVNDVSFHVKPGEVFGFLGPNGSGKTTTIRMALNIIKPNKGTVSLLGVQPKLSMLWKVGYLPEEVGLPPKVKIIDTVRYFARLKGLPKKEAETRTDELLHAVGLFDHRFKKMEALSHGMRQMTQFAVAIAARPQLLILDEPFAGLDPLNVNLMKQILMDLRQNGTTIMFSTHIMSDVEEMCERIALIADSKLLLFGELAEIRRQRGVKSVQVQAPAIPEELQTAEFKKHPGEIIEFTINKELTPEHIFQSYAAANIPVDRFERMLPSLNDIFIEEVSKARKGSKQAEEMPHEQ